MNKYWASIICTAIVCLTVISYFFFFEKERFIYEKFGDKVMIRVDKQTGQTWVYKTNGKWEQVNEWVW